MKVEKVLRYVAVCCFTFAAMTQVADDIFAALVATFFLTLAFAMAIQINQEEA